METITRTFTHEQLGDIRVLGTQEEPLFVANDIATALGYKNTRDAIAKHVNDEDKNTVAIHDGIGNPNKVIINESGMYALIFGSKLEQAKRFKHWVTSEVLPTIRRQGSYGELSNIADSLSKTMATLNNITKTITDSHQTMATAMVDMIHATKCLVDSAKSHNQDQNQERPSTIPNKDEITASEICGTLGFVSAHELNNRLVQLGVIARNGASITLSAKYQHIGKVKQWNSANGYYTTYVVYTPSGVEELKRLVK